MNLIDLSHTISHGMPVFPGEKVPSINRDALPEDVGYVTHRLESNMHTGTHIDAPFHVKSGNLTIDSYAPGHFVGQAVVIDVRNQLVVHMLPEWEQLFMKYSVVLFCTSYSSNWKTEAYYYDYPEFDVQIAEILVDCGVKIAGFDSPSPDKEPFAFHSIFLQDERFLVENLTNLERLLGEENITFIAMPLKIEAEASLLRAIAMIAE